MLSHQRAIIFVNGQMQDRDYIKAYLNQGDFLVAADGGLNHILDLGLLPNVLIGDLDSTTVAQQMDMAKHNVLIEKFSADKNETDLELAIQYCVDKGFQVIRLIAGLGGRLDQTLGNLALLTQPYWSNLDLRFQDGLEEVWIIKGYSTVLGEIDDVVSLIPLGQPVEGVRTTGLKYPLNNETLFPEKTRGISNRLSASPATIFTLGGNLLCIHTRKRKF